MPVWLLFLAVVVAAVAAASLMALAVNASVDLGRIADALDRIAKYLAIQIAHLEQGAEPTDAPARMGGAVRDRILKVLSRARRHPADWGSDEGWVGRNALWEFMRKMDPAMSTRTFEEALGELLVNHEIAWRATPTSYRLDREG